MRTIKFRAWDKKNKVMIFDNDKVSDYPNSELYVNLNGEIRIIMGESLRGNCGGKDLHDVPWGNDNCELNQFTGLTDKNGKLIFEGDIIKTDKNIHCEVRWDNKKSHFDVRYVNKWDLRNKKPGKTFNFYLYKSLIWAAERGVVVGNVYENEYLIDHNKDPFNLTNT